MITQVENKVKEIKALKRKEYYKQKDTDLQNWGIAKEGKGKKATPIVITDEEYENGLKEKYKELDAKINKVSDKLEKETTGRDAESWRNSKKQVWSWVLNAILGLIAVALGISKFV